MSLNCVQSSGYLEKHVICTNYKLYFSIFNIEARRYNFSGTLSGVILGCPEAEQSWLKSGDKMEVYIEKLGTLINVLE
ncbi:fumarylacetoacetate hydrolase family protein [Clostridium hydrogenum]|uniref:fumarylacetoacetate hydrolase family protein n=1 Tax=Clostridium hydrogenum TaxID=2855764 RepID=UPI002E34843D|nr:fumarylacetoacetate hydrolase family protein [Clostridium hydrogenum]